MIEKKHMLFSEFKTLPVLQDILVTEDGATRFDQLNEGKWISGRFDRNIRIDQPTHGVGQVHAHVLGRKKDEIGVVNFDGSSSHGTKCRLADADANALRARGFQISVGNVVEWVVLAEQDFILLLS